MGAQGEKFMTEIYRNIAWKLINLRQREGLTQEQLGRKVGLSKYQLSRLERGQGEITLENTAKIRSLDIQARSIRKMKIEKNLRYEIYALEGTLIVRTCDESQEIDKAQILSIKGSGTLKLVNMNSKSATVLTIAY